MRSGLARESCSPADPEGHLSCTVAQAFIPFSVTVYHEVRRPRRIELLIQGPPV